MPYLSLYRKYRPRSFAEILGQRHVTQTLTNAVKAGRIAHAYLFCGPRGTGKTSTARVLAMALNCEHGPTPEPCGECETCRRIIAGSALDVIEIDAASNRGIDEIRQLRERVALAAADARTKVYIIDEVHMLTGEAFNAFLKTLEEPPSHVVFVLATTEPHRVLPTILSRCQRFDFHRIGMPEIEASLREIARKEQVTIEDTAISLLAHAADGSARDALTLFDQAIAYAEGPVTTEIITDILGGIDFDLVAEFAEVLLQSNLSAALALIDRVIAEGKDLRQLMGSLIEHYRNLLLLSVDRRGEGALALPEEARRRIAAQAKLVSTSEITRTLNLLAEADRELRFSSQPRLLVELAAVRTCRELAPARAVAAPAPGAEAAGVAEAEPVAQEIAPRPEPASVAEGAGAPQEGEPLSVGEMKRRWDDLLADLRKARQIPLTAIMREALPVALEGDVLTLSFNHEFHHDQMARDQQRLRTAAEAIERVFGRRVTIKCRMSSEPGPGETPASAKPGKRAAGSPSQKIQDALTAFPGSEIDE